MTLPPHIKVGDGGQRYEVRATGWPKPQEAGEQPIGWCDKLIGAESMMEGALLAPGCTYACIWDRQENKKVITRYGGILR